jgi:hypothetical protein
MVSDVWGDEGYLFQHAGILTLAARYSDPNTLADGKWTQFKSNGVDVRSVAPDYVNAVAVSDSSSLLPSSINVSWQDHSDNDSGFIVQRYDVTNGTATLGGTWTVQDTWAIVKCCG